MPGCPDSDELVTFEDLLEGRAGHVEQQAALQFQCLRDAGQASQHVEAPGRVFADETGPDLRIGGNSGGLMLLLVSLTLQQIRQRQTLLPFANRDCSKLHRRDACMAHGPCPLGGRWC